MQLSCQQSSYVSKIKRYPTTSPKLICNDQKRYEKRWGSQNRWLSLYLEKVVQSISLSEEAHDSFKKGRQERTRKTMKMRPITRLVQTRLLTIDETNTGQADP